MTTEAQKLLMDCLPSSPPPGTGPVVWQRVLAFVFKRLRSLPLITNEQGRIANLKPDSLLQWYHAYCDTRALTGGRPYSRRQRHNIRASFEFIRSTWKDWIAGELLLVENYPRAPRPALFNAGALQLYRLSNLEKLRLVFARELMDNGVALGRLTHQKPPDLDGEDSLRYRFYNLCFALITFVGVTFPGCFASFCRLQIKHVPTNPRQQLIIPRNLTGQRWIPVSLDDIAHLCLIGVLSRLSRGVRCTGVRRRQLKPLGPEMYLTGEQPDSAAMRALREGFNQWLTELCLQAAVPTLTLELLIEVAKARLPQMYCSEVIHALTGRISYHPLPSDQAVPTHGPSIVEQYRTEIKLPEWDYSLESGSVTQRLARGKAKSVSPPALVEATSALDETFAKCLCDVCRPYVDGEITGIALAGRLEEFAQGLINTERSAEPIIHSLRACYAAIQPALKDAAQSGDPKVIQGFNVACIAAWLSHRLRVNNSRIEKRIRNVNTLVAYRRDALFLAREFPNLCLTEIGDDELDLVRAFDASAQSILFQSGPERQHIGRRSAMTTLRSLRRFLVNEVKLEVASLSGGGPRTARSTREKRLVGPGDLEKLLRECQRRGTLEAYCAYLAILLAYFAGLRAIEIVRLKLSHIVRKRPSHVYVRRGKRRKTRIVYLHPRATSFLEIITQARDRRYKQTRDLTSPLVPILETGLFAKRDKPPSDYEQAKRLSEWVVELMEAVGLRNLGLCGDLPNLHRLRHDYFNSLFVISLEERRLDRAKRFGYGPYRRDLSSWPADSKYSSVSGGHATEKVTREQYRHCQNALQAEQINAWTSSGQDEIYAQCVALARPAIGNLLDLDSTQAKVKLRDSGLAVRRLRGQKAYHYIPRLQAISWLYTEISAATDKGGSWRSKG